MSTKSNTNPAVTQGTKRRLLESISNEIGNKTIPKNALVSVGFTVKNCTRLIGQTLNDPDVLGWFFMVNGGVEGKVADIAVRQLAIRTQGTTRRLVNEILLDNNEPVFIQPKVNIQLPEPDLTVLPSLSDYRELPYADAKEITRGDYYNSDQAFLPDLTHYAEWAEACFVRRSDLKYMQILLLAESRPGGEQYNDLFFSGSLVRYDIMHNARLRLMQFTLEYPGGVVPDSGTAFTLKAEPIRNTIEADEVITGTPMLAALEADLTNSGPAAAAPKPNEATGGVMFPGAVMALPCPDYWYIINEIGNYLDIETPNAALTLMRSYEAIESVVSNTPSSGVAQAELEDLLNNGGSTTGPDRSIIHQILTAIIDFFTALRDGLTA